MAKLTKKDVLHVAKLANLNLKEDEVDKFLPQLSSIVEFISKLNEVDTNQVEPTSQTTGLTNVYRNDEPNLGNCLSQEEATSGTSQIYNGYFKVKAILTERSDK